ncbi:TonB-dependent receptor [Rheinheimera sp.]|uniref:TonB-dependent receptor n=1 Tax=Rheinheimera sp. TaxID=1869214 RepID=UPI00307D896A
MRYAKKSLLALSIASFIGMPAVALAEDIVGTINAANSTTYKVSVKNTATGLSREVTPASNGAFRISSLPTGEYELTIAKDGKIVTTDKVRVSLGSNTQASYDLASSGSEGLEVIQVTGSRINPIDLTTSDSGLVMGEIELDRMPVPRNLTSVALLAPGTVAGDTRFGNVASFGGASVAENTCYINGLEVTDTSQGLGCGSVPFEFYKEFQVKTGGYSAEFGRTTGGLINSTTKSGTNEWEFAVTGLWTPASLAESGRISKGNGGVGSAFRNTTQDEYSAKEVTISAGGPLIEDKLFIYALVNPRDIQDDFASRSGSTQYAADNQFIRRDSSGGDNLFWGTKIDWLITDQHTLSLFAYSNRSDTNSETYSFNANTSEIGSLLGSTVLKRGGDVKSLSYTGNFTDELTVTAMYGEIETQYTNVPGNLDCPTVTDARPIPDSQKITSCGPGGSYGDNVDNNEQLRLNVEYVLGDHLLRAGYDTQTRDTNHTSFPITGHNWTYRTLATGGSIQGNDGALYVNNTGAALDYVADRIFAGGGGFTTELDAWYLEDEWQATDNLRLSLGVRKDKFENAGVTGLVFSSFSTDIAPRLGFSYDPTGEGTSKIFGTYGRYYLPVPNNTNYRAASGVSDTTTYYLFTGSDATGAATGLTPIAGANSTVVNSVPNPAVQATFQAEEADPFAKDEYILGYETQLTDEITGSVRGIYREVVSALDDYCGPLASQATCTLLNPGEDSTWQLDNDADGVIDPDSRQTYTAAEIGLPEAKNEYTALQTQLAYAGERTRFTLVYTWSRSVGNFEGAVKSDIGQADPGITQDFDFPALMDGADGYQANDRRHVFKLYGSYDLLEDLTVGFNSTLASGRPMSAFGRGYPDDDPMVYGSYGDTFYLYDPVSDTYSFVPRGSIGRTPWSFKLDLSANYMFELGGVDMRATLNIFNVLDSQEIESINEHYETTPGVKNQYYGAAYTWQEPRSIQLGLEARF